MQFGNRSSPIFPASLHVSLFRPEMFCRDSGPLGLLFCFPSFPPRDLQLFETDGAQSCSCKCFSPVFTSTQVVGAIFSLPATHAFQSPAPPHYFAFIFISVGLSSLCLFLPGYSNNLCTVVTFDHKTSCSIGTLRVFFPLLRSGFHFPFLTNFLTPFSGCLRFFSIQSSCWMSRFCFPVFIPTIYLGDPSRMGVFFVFYWTNPGQDLFSALPLFSFKINF